MAAPTRQWQEIAQEQQALRDAKIPKEWLLKDLPAASVADVMRVPYESRIMTETELALTEKDATELLGLMAAGKLKSEDLTRAFCKRAAIAQQLVRIHLAQSCPYLRTMIAEFR
jgi:amidase